MKPTKDFRLSKQYKCRLALMKVSDELRSLWKKSFIEAQLSIEEHRKSKISNKGD